MESEVNGPITNHAKKKRPATKRMQPIRECGFLWVNVGGRACKKDHLFLPYIPSICTTYCHNATSKIYPILYTIWQLEGTSNSAFFTINLVVSSMRCTRVRSWYATRVRVSFPGVWVPELTADDISNGMRACKQFADVQS